MYTITGTQKEVYLKLLISDKTSFFSYSLSIGSHNST